MNGISKEIERCGGFSYLFLCCELRPFDDKEFDDLEDYVDFSVTIVKDHVMWFLDGGSKLQFSFT